MEQWINGAKGSEVKRVIDSNFDILDKRTIKINNDILKSSPLSIELLASNWVFDESLKTYTISIPYADYERETPCVYIYIKNEDGYSPVYGGYTMGENSIKLQSDMAYNGKVVIR